MKAISIFLIIISSWTSFAQSDNLVGDYTLLLNAEENHILEYKLTLSQEGTFFFHYYTKIKHGIPPEVTKYGKGTWTVENNVISFFVDKQKDISEKYTLDFTNAKARFITKPPRDKTDRVIKTRLKFLQSDLFWMKGIDMLKI